jgi:hypothetical protein
LLELAELEQTAALLEQPRLLLDLTQLRVGVVITAAGAVQNGVDDRFGAPPLLVDRRRPTRLLGRRRCSRRWGGCAGLGPGPGGLVVIALDRLGLAGTLALAVALAGLPFLSTPHVTVAVAVVAVVSAAGAVAVVLGGAGPVALPRGFVSIARPLALPGAVPVVGR